MKRCIIAVFIASIGWLNITAQIKANDSCNCPPQYTHSEILNSYIEISKVAVLDSIKYSTLPFIVDDLNSLAKRIIYPDIALRAGVIGKTKYLIKINQEGKVHEIKIIRGIGAGLDEAIISELKNLNFVPAKINDQPVESDIHISVNYQIKKTIDKPAYEFDEINYEGNKGSIWYRLKIIFTKDGSACLYEDTGSKIEESLGIIHPYFYTKLSDFILSECFFSYDSIYYNSISDMPKTTVTVSSNNKVKIVSAFGDENTPIGWWAIKNLILHLKNQIKWEVVRSESTIKQLPKK